MSDEQRRSQDRSSINRWSTRSFVVFGTGYILFLTALIAMLFWTRSNVIRNTDPESIAHWQQWVEEAEKQAEGDGPVKRRPPQSDVPPAYVLMQDFFPICLFATFLFGTALYVTFAYLIRGVLTSPGRQGAGETRSGGDKERGRQGAEETRSGAGTRHE